MALGRFEAVSYRGIDGLALPLTKANLITGANGIGKTALLEAIWLFAGRHNPGLLWNANVQRGNSPPVDPIAPLTDGRVELCGVVEGSPLKVGFEFERLEDATSSGAITAALHDPLMRLPTATVRIRTYVGDQLADDGQDRICFAPTARVLYRTPFADGCRAAMEPARLADESASEYHKRYSHLVRDGCKSDLLRALNLAMQEVENTELLADDDGESYLSVTIGGKTHALHDLGGGAMRMFRLLLGFSHSRDGIVLADELENGIHHSAQRPFWHAARGWMDKWNVQFVATTHNAEVIDAAMCAFDDARDDLSIHKLRRHPCTGRIRAATFTGEALEGVRGLNLEVR